MNPLRSLGLLLTSFGLASTLAAQSAVIEPRFEVPYPANPHYAGRHLAFIGDSDGDGCDDFIVANPWEWNGSASQTGSIKSYSGRTGGLRYTIFGDNSGFRLGFAVAAIGGDRFVAGAPWATQSGATWQGYVRVYSGTGALLFSLPGGVAASRAAQFGLSVAGAGDADGDGTPDFLVGVPRIDSGDSGPDHGSAIVFSGQTGNIIRRLIGQPINSVADEFGTSVGNAGDVDGDGYDDHVVGAPGDGVPDGGGNPRGAVYVFNGRTGALLADFRDTTFNVPPYPLYRFGTTVNGAGDIDGDGRDDIVASPINQFGSGIEIWSVMDRRQIWTSLYGRFQSAAGDVDGDGRSDLVLGEPPVGGGTAQNGWVRVLAGGSLTTLHSFIGTFGGALPQLGYAVAAGGDLNGDGFGDYLFETYGSVRAYLGRPRAAFERFHLEGEAMDDRLGQALGSAGDVDGDGRDDLVIGAYLDDDAAGADQGSVRVVDGDGQEIYRWTGDAVGDYFGVAVDGAGDVDGDGVPDVIVGASGADAGALADAGLARIHSGADGHVLHTWYGDAAGDGFGRAVAAAGDVDRDGHDDVIVGAVLGDAPTVADTGSVRVLSGSDGRTLWTFHGNAAGDRFGYAVDGVGDVTGDGIPDLAVGAYAEDGPNGTDSGCVYLFSGADGTEILRLHGDQANDRFGVSVRGAGDVDGDGRPDVIAGAYLYSQYGSRGHALVFRGDGTVIHDLRASNQWGIGSAVSGAGDVNGDGHADLIVGGHGVVRVCSGRDGGVLMYQFDGSSTDGYGLTVAGAGDTDGDGFAEVLFGAYVASPQGVYRAGAAWLWSFGYGASPELRPGTLRTYGAGCPGANGRLPRIGAERPGTIGERLPITLRGGPVGAPSSAVLLLGARQSLSLDPIGLFGCTMLVAPFAQPAVTTDAAGSARFELPVPTDEALIGASVHGQWLVVDSGAPRVLPLAFSDGLAAVIGR